MFIGQHLELAGGLLFVVVGLLRFPLRTGLIVSKVHLTAKFTEYCEEPADTSGAGLVGHGRGRYQN